MISYLQGLILGLLHRDALRDRGNPVRLFLAGLAPDSAGPWRSIRGGYIVHDDTDAKLGWLLVVATIPAGLLGLVLEHKLRSLFASPESAAIFLFLNGVMLLGAERLRKRAPGDPEPDEDVDSTIVRRIRVRSALGIGMAQAVALIPGFSRSGASMGGGLLAGLSNEEAARSWELSELPSRPPERPIPAAFLRDEPSHPIWHLLHGPRRVALGRVRRHLDH